MANINQAFGSRIQQGWQDIITHLRGLLQSTEHSNDNVLAAPTQGNLFSYHALNIIVTEPGEHTRAVAWAIAGAIASGVNRRQDILAFASKAVSTTPRHVGYHLNRLAGSDPAVHRWELTDEETYRLLAPTRQQAA